MRVFTECGHDGTSLQHLTQASGLSRSSVYHHIESKEQLLRLGLERALTNDQSEGRWETLSCPAHNKLVVEMRR
ncbi:hypothetical protein GCM10027200_39750 [Lentzea nigeriaca]